MCENNDNNYLDKIIETSSKIKTTIVYRVWLINKKSSNLILEKILKLKSKNHYLLVYINFQIR